LTHKTPFRILNSRKSNFLSIINPDAMEAAAYEHFFGGGAKPLITSLKGATGENFASGGIRAVALALSLRERIVPPVVGLRTPRSPAVRHRVLREPTREPGAPERDLLRRDIRLPGVRGKSITP
jgi:hypothetical protein